MRSKKIRFSAAFASLCLLAGALVPGGVGCGELETEDPFVVPLEGVAPEGEYVPNQYIFFFRQGIQDAEMVRTEKQFADLGGKKLRDHALFKAFTGEIGPDGLAIMRRNSKLASITVNGIIRATSIQQCPPSWGLDVIDQDGPIMQNNYYAYPSDGSGVHVYVLDSGIQRQMKDAQGMLSDGKFHDEFKIDATKTRIGAGLCTATDCCTNLPNCSTDIDDQLKDPTNLAKNWDDVHGHGTHLAGIVGGKTYGVAKGVQLHSVRVLKSSTECASPEGTTDTFLAGLDAVVKLQDIEKQASPMKIAPPAVVLLGFNGPVNGSWTKLFEKLNKFDPMNNTIPRDMVIVASAGNAGKDACDYFPGGNNGAAADPRTVITVGAFNEQGQIWPDSNTGPCVDILAPGAGIWGPVSDDCPIDTAGSTSRVHRMDGTSQAAAHVAGVAALLLGSGLKPSEVKSALFDLARRDVLDMSNSKTANLALRSPPLSIDEVVQASASCIDIPANGRLTCDPHGKCGFCGAETTACCPGAGLPCATGFICDDVTSICQTPCGLMDESCCGSECLDDALTCADGICKECGFAPKMDGTRYPCCKGNCFGDNVTCNAKNECVVCGLAPVNNQNYPCCDGKCFGPNLLCDSNNECINAADCGAATLPCCANKSCGAGLQCVNEKCEPVPSCGADTESCCAGDTCNAGLYCNGSNGMKKCAPCGAHGEPCCPPPANECDGNMTCDYQPDGTGGKCNSTCHVRCHDGELGFPAPYPDTYKFVTQFDCSQWANDMCLYSGGASRVFFNEVPIPGLNNCGANGEACCMELDNCVDSDAQCYSEPNFPDTAVVRNNKTIGIFYGKAYCRVLTDGGP